MTKWVYIPTGIVAERVAVASSRGTRPPPQSSPACRCEPYFLPHGSGVEIVFPLRGVVSGGAVFITEETERDSCPVQGTMILCIHLALRPRTAKTTSIACRLSASLSGRGYGHPIREGSRCRSWKGELERHDSVHSRSCLFNSNWPVQFSVMLVLTHIDCGLEMVIKGFPRLNSVDLQASLFFEQKSRLEVCASYPQGAMSEFDIVNARQQIWNAIR